MVSLTHVVAAALTTFGLGCTTWWFANTGPAQNDGHTTCNGTFSGWPFLLCRGYNGGPKSYFCMWHTALDIHEMGCDAIDFDCESSYVCTALKCYSKLCSEAPQVDDKYLGPAADCLEKKCGLQALNPLAVAARESRDAKCPDGTSRRLGARMTPAMTSAARSTMPAHAVWAAAGALASGVALLLAALARHGRPSCGSGALEAEEQVVE